MNQFAAASAADDADPGLHFLLGVAYLGLGMPENARLELEMTLELRPTDVQALTLLGTLLSRDGQRDLAVAAWRQALAVDPGNAQARFSLSRTLADEALAARIAGREAEAARCGCWPGEPTRQTPRSLAALRAPKPPASAPNTPPATAK